VTEPHQRTQAEEIFIDQYTRSLLVRWADYQVQSPTGILIHAVSEADMAAFRTGTCDNTTRMMIVGIAEIRKDLEMFPVYLDHAVVKGWVSKTEPRKLLAKGFEVAAAFLKR